ncbi:hypothetical protein [Clostridium saccharoperbutylacetonicum]
MPYDFKNQIKDILDSSSRFDADDFSIAQNSSKIIISYIYSKNNYYFNFSIPDQKQEVNDDNRFSSLAPGRAKKWVYIFKGSMIPGRYSVSESFSYNSFDEVRNEIREWLDYLYYDLEEIMNNLKNKTSTGNDEEFEKCKINLEEIEKKIDEQIDENEVFSTDEKQELSIKLNEIKNEFEEKLKGIILEQESLKAELDKLNKDFSKLKDSLNYMSKKNWCKKFVIKAKEFLSDPNKRKVAFTTIKGVNIFLKNLNVDIPLLDEGIDAIEQVSGDKSK